LEFYFKKLEFYFKKVYIIDEFIDFGRKRISFSLRNKELKKLQRKRKYRFRFDQKNFVFLVKK